DGARPRPLAGAPRLLRGRVPFLGRRALRGLCGPHRHPVRRLGDAHGVDPRTGGPLPAGNGRLFRARPRDDARRRARSQPIPRRATHLVSEKFQAPRGTHDVLPSDRRWWQLVATIEELTAVYGYGRIQTPGFEDTGLFQRTSGEASDVVHKEMYTFADRGDRSPTRRPATSGRPAPCGSSTSRTRRCALASRRLPRSARHCVTPAASTSMPCGATSTRTESSTSSNQRSCAGSTTTREPRSSSSGRTKT